MKWHFEMMTTFAFVALCSHINYTNEITIQLNREKSIFINYNEKRITLDKKTEVRMLRLSFGWLLFALFSFVLFYVLHEQKYDKQFFASLK